MSQREEYIKVFKRYVAEGFEAYLADLCLKHHVRFKVVKPRKSKLGDFSVKSAKSTPQITVNGNLNPYAFLITSLHEFAHLITYLQHGWKVAPHGKEWKNNFKELLLPVIFSDHTPTNICEALKHSVGNLKASSCNDKNLQRVLSSFDKEDDGHLLETLPKNAIFALSGKQFVKGELRRTRFLCNEVSGRKQYLVHRTAKVIHLEQNNHG